MRFLLVVLVAGLAVVGGIVLVGLFGYTDTPMP
jgi:hypothetical protein